MAVVAMPQVSGAKEAKADGAAGAAGADGTAKVAGAAGAAKVAGAAGAAKVAGAAGTTMVAGAAGELDQDGGSERTAGNMRVAGMSSAAAPLERIRRLRRARDDR